METEPNSEIQRQNDELRFEEECELVWDLVGQHPDGYVPILYRSRGRKPYMMWEPPLIAELALAY